MNNRYKKVATLNVSTGLETTTLRTIYFITILLFYYYSIIIIF